MKTLCPSFVITSSAWHGEPCNFAVMACQSVGGELVFVWPIKTSARRNCPANSLPKPHEVGPLRIATEDGQLIIHSHMNIIDVDKTSGQ